MLDTWKNTWKNLKNFHKEIYVEYNQANVQFLAMADMILLATGKLPAKRRKLWGAFIAEVQKRFPNLKPHWAIIGGKLPPKGRKYFEELSQPHKIL